MGLFEPAHGYMGRGGGAKRHPLLKNCHAYPTIMKVNTVVPYLKKFQKYINYVTHPISLLTLAFSPKINRSTEVQI